MANVNPTLGARNALTVTGYSTLASANYVATSAYNCDTNKPYDVVIDVEALTTNAPAGNKQVVVFLKESVDGTNFRSGPESGTTTTDEPNLKYVGTIPMATASVTQRGSFSLLNALGYIPKAFKIVLKNDLGVALTGGAVYAAEQTMSIA